MSLTGALNSARNSITAVSAQVEAVTRNIGGANDANRSRKVIDLTTNASGAVEVSVPRRLSDDPLYERLITANSQASAREAMYAKLNQLQAGVGVASSKQSPSAQLSALLDALRAYRNSPEEKANATAFVNASKNLAASLKTAATAVRKVRQDADADMKTGVDKINDLLKQLEVENNLVVSGTKKGDDVSDALDRRDAIIKQISEQMGVSVVRRPDNEIALYTDSGVTLFDKGPRTVSFQATAVYDDGTTGNAIYVDGVAVTGADAPMPLKGGALAGLAELRDKTAPTYAKQLDEIARRLVEAFSETDAAGANSKPGVFTAGTPYDPTAPGAAYRLAVNAAVDPAQGGSADKVRDGGINGAAYVKNSATKASFSGQLETFVTALGAKMTFDPASGLPTQTTLTDFTNGSVGWLAQQRQNVKASADTAGALRDQLQKNLSNKTGVNLNDEYAQQLALEKSFQASSKLVALINGLFDSLLQMVR